MKKTTRAWVRKAEADYVLAVQASQSDVPVHDGVCFHCQQCVEKYLKGLMDELGLHVPKTHVLVLLLATLVTHDCGLIGADWCFSRRSPWTRGILEMTPPN